MPAIMSPATTAAAISSGDTKLRSRFRRVAFRQAMTGPIPVSASSTSPIGMLTRLKNAGPTATLVPATPSEISGKSVPQSTANADPSRIRLFIRNADSRERNDSMVRSARRSSLRHRMRSRHAIVATPRKARKM